MDKTGPADIPTEKSGSPTSSSSGAWDFVESQDLITEDDSRWPPGLYDLPKRHGKLPDLKKFDAQFFGVTPKQANFMDPQVRLLLEVTWEAMIDAGINPQSLRGSRTGVFVGCSASETGSALTQDPDTVTGYTLTGCVRSMFSNRISFAFDLQGPSFSVDTACSSSLCAMQLAIDAIRQGQCDAAVVAGAHLTLTPTVSLQFLRLGMLSGRGSCRSFDESGDGYCRTEGVAAILLQRKSAANRIYASVLHAKSNTDGYKEHGITFPSGERQAALLQEIYSEAGIDPNTVTYVETHGTGTKVGDPQEANAITQVFCQNRANPLLIGSVKSNMGHAEPASGLCSVAKMMVAINNGTIPANLHYNSPNQHIPGLTDGRLKVVSENTPLPEGSVIGLNSFGFGGSNTHVILRTHKNPVQDIEKPMTFRRIHTYCGRTDDSVKHIFEKIQEYPDNAALQHLFAVQSNILPKDAPFRGYYIEGKDGKAPLIDVQKVPITEQRPIYFVYSGMGSQWPGMGRALMVIPAFDESLRKSSKSLEQFGLDVYGMLCNPDPAQYQNNTLNCMLAITAIQIALTDLMYLMGVQPDGVIGHSTGEMGCGYSDGGLTREQTMQLAYHRGTTIMNSKVPIVGAMAAVGLSWEEATKRCPEGVVPACHNAAESVTISGDAAKISEFLEQLKSEDIFAKPVDSSGIPFHSPAMQIVKDAMLDAMKTVVPEPKLRSSKWISTSIPEDDWESDLAMTCSADYHVHNACSPVLFHEAIQKIPPNAVTIEMAPHSIMNSILRRSLQKTCTNVGLMTSRSEDPLESFLKELGRIYQAGVNINIAKLFPAVTLPVPSNTPMIGPMWKWDHSVDWPVIDGRQMAVGGGGVAATSTYNIDPFAADSKDAYLLDHAIDGRVLFPFTGHMVLAWKTLCKLKSLDFQKTPVVLEDINVYNATIITKPIKLDVVIAPGTGHFEILDGEQIAASGKIYIPDEKQEFYYKDFHGIRTSSIAERIRLDGEDIYKEFLLRGYEYGTAFRGIYDTCNSGEEGTLYFNGNWVTFLDALLQTALLAERADTLRLPTRVRYLRIDPVKHLEHVVERDGIQVVELRNDVTTNGCIAGGVECCDLNAHTVSRRMQQAGQIYYEKLHYVKHFDNNALKEFPRVCHDLESYRNVLRSVVANGLSLWEKNGHLAKFTNGAFLQDALKKLTALKGDVSEEEYNKYLHETKTAIIHALDELFAMDFSTQTAAEAEEAITRKMNEVIKTFDNDKFWSCALCNDRILKTMQDICIENSAGHHNKFCGVELSSTEQLKYCTVSISSHPLLEISWNCVGPNVDQLDENTLEQMGARKFKTNFDGPEFNVPNDAKNHDYLLIDKMLRKKVDPSLYLQRCAELLREDGFMIVNEITQDYELAVIIDGLLGSKLEGPADRTYGTYFTHEQLLELFTSNGFRVCNFQRDPCMFTTTYIIRKIPQEPRDPVFVDVDDIKEFTWIEPLQNVIEQRLKEPDSKTIWLHNSKVRNNGVLGMSLCFIEENLKANRFRTLIDISVKKEAREGPPVIGLDNPEVQKMIELDLHANNYRDGEWGSVRHMVVRDDEVHSYTETEHAFINTLVRNDMSSLTWIESPNQYFNDVTNRRATQELCSVYYSAINFRDIMLASGRLPPDAIPGQFA
uniref:Fatty acid synthase n=1 Tax=Steinernema glaseri TaxID=37863 RepID=A0A1I7ZWW4_9BILA